MTKNSWEKMDFADVKVGMKVKSGKGDTSRKGKIVYVDFSGFDISWDDETTSFCLPMDSDKFLFKPQKISPTKNQTLTDQEVYEIIMSDLEIMHVSPNSVRIIEQAVIKKLDSLGMINKTNE